MCNGSGRLASTSPHVTCFLSQVVSPLGGSLNLLFKVQRAGSEQARKLPEGTDSGVLGKLAIKWRTNLGDVGRLQTQSITASAAAIKDISLQVSCQLAVYCLLMFGKGNMLRQENFAPSQ